MSSTLNWPKLLAISLALLFVAIVVWIVMNFIRDMFPASSTEIQTGMIVALAICGLLFVLTVMAAVYHGLKLASRDQPLGLPEGSIRALIALFLIMIFIIMGIYLFRTVATSNGVVITGLTLEQISNLPGPLTRIEKSEIDGSYSVSVNAISDSAVQLALQLITLLGTLVTAVSAFYFGSSTATSAARAAKESPSTPADLSVEDITPPSGGTDTKGLNIEITGEGFMPGAKVTLKKKGEPNIDAVVNQVINGSKITCTLDLTIGKIGKWDVVVINPDGNRLVAPKLFEIKEAESTPNPSSTPTAS